MEKELVTQTGHAIEQWPLVIAKELFDNALDACEEADIAPIVRVTADAGGITVTDNGPGLPEATLKAALDFTILASSREAYVAPDREAQGNALKTIVAIPSVIAPETGKTILESLGKRHVVRCLADPISRRVVVQHETTAQSTAGNSVRVEWGSRTVAKQIMWPFSESFCAQDTLLAVPFERLIEGFAVFNPHASFQLDWFGARKVWKATDCNWPKWKPCWPTSAHWYEPQHLERLIGAYITSDRECGRDRLVTEFLAEFDGFSGSQKRSRVLRDTDLRRARLTDLIVGDRLDSERVTRLLRAMQQHTRPVNPKRLGIIGEQHLRTRLLGMGVRPESFRYACKLQNCKKARSLLNKESSADDVPWVLESAFGWLGDDAVDGRQFFAGVNWSAAIHNPFRSFGTLGEGLEAELTEMRAGADEPIVVVVHLACPRVEYTDRGKSAIVVGGDA